jgi:hypothetical protein
MNINVEFALLFPDNFAAFSKCLYDSALRSGGKV